MPDYNPYTISQCRTCPVARGDDKANLTAFIPQSNLWEACNILRAVNVADAKQVRMRAKKTIQGKELRNAGFNHKVVVRGSSIKEWTNLPHNKYRAKNRALLDIKNLFYSAKYLGCTDDHKLRKDVVQSHVFECEIAGEASYILVLEYTWGGVRPSLCFRLAKHCQVYKKEIANGATPPELQSGTEHQMLFLCRKDTNMN